MDLNDNFFENSKIEIVFTSFFSLLSPKKLLKVHPNTTQYSTSFLSPYSILLDISSLTP